MRSATGAIQSVLVLGGGSEIAAAVIDAMDSSRLQRIDLAVRTPASVDARVAELERRGISARALRYDADDPAAHDTVVATSAADGDLDLVIVAFGVLGPTFDLDAPADRTVALVSTNGAAACGAVHAAARHLQHQGHGTLVVLSSVAGQRVRAENAPYGAAKAALDGYTRAVADRLAGSGVRVVLVRPGFVRGRMTEGRPDAPFATDPAAVAADVVTALAGRSERPVWSPRILRSLFAALRAAPVPVWRRITR